jgi:tetratricopeptide (TPR) repeat protein
MMRWKIHGCVLLLMAAALSVAWAGDRPPRIWILPFDNPEANASVAHLEEAIPALLAVAISQSDRHAVVDRQHLSQVLAEQSLTLEGLTAQHTRHEVGRLLGATVMISGSFVKQGPDLLITMRASDAERGMVTATAEARGPAGQVGRLVSDLYRRLARDLGRRLPEPRADQIDEAPLSNLHFMRGLGYYYSARYNQALAEFLQATPEKSLANIARLWLANAYLAQGEYDHAYLELNRLRLGGARNVRKAEVEAKMRACEKHLSAEEVERIRELATVPASVKR